MVSTTAVRPRTFIASQVRISDKVQGYILMPSTVPSEATVHSQPSAVRIEPPCRHGPPRKPRQSGHALWVGNLPISANIITLKDHFSTGLTEAIESVFLISKSKSAFVNYATNATLLSALGKFHDSKFEGVRLVCRLRKAANDIGPGSASTRFVPTLNKESIEVSKDEDHGSREKGSVESGLTDRAKKRFFIMKSLGMDALESSVRSRRWMTQPHNEATLKEAFESSDEVYLVFSANKSGEYFGYARLRGMVEETALQSPSMAPAEVAQPWEWGSPQTIFTSATESAPAGSVLIDASRDIVFWEAGISGQHSSVQTVPEQKDVNVDTGCAKIAEGEHCAVGSPLEVEWISTSRVPFYCTRDLRNPWNANREVKIARDGTELETEVGTQLLKMFHQYTPPMPYIPSATSLLPTDTSISSAQPERISSRGGKKEAENKENKVFGR